MINENQHIRQVARRLIAYVKEQERKVEPAELDASWQEVAYRIAALRQKRTRQLYLYMAGSSVAAVLIGCMFWIGLSLQTDKESDIERFAQSTEIRDTDRKEILLLVPGEDEIRIHNTNARINYGAGGEITVNSENILHEKRDEIEYNQLIIPKGKRLQLTLSDGTKVWVNSGTRIVYPDRFERKKREIYVEGEVYLDVVRNEKAPFIVRTHEFQVQVLGTSFNVSAYPTEKQSSVVLVEGSVHVTDEHKHETVLRPGQLADIQVGQLGEPRDVDVAPYVSWIHNMLMYENEPLEYVFRKLNLYYNQEFILTPDVADLRVSGKLDLKENIEDVLHAIAFAVPIVYEQTDEKTIVKKK